MGSVLVPIVRVRNDRREHVRTRGGMEVMDRTSRTTLEQITEDRRALAANAAHVRVQVGAMKASLSRYLSIPGTYAEDMDKALDTLCAAANGADAALAREGEKELAISDAVGK